MFLLLVYLWYLDVDRIFHYEDLQEPEPKTRVELSVKLTTKSSEMRYDI